MYYVEKMLYQFWFTEEGQRTMDDPVMTANEKLIRETGRDKDGNEHWSIHKPASETPRALASLYTQNDRFLEFRTPSDEKRGLITMIATLWGGVASLSLFGAIIFILGIFRNYGLLLTIVGIICSIATFVLSLKYFKKKNETSTDPGYDPMLDAFKKLLLAFAVLIGFFLFSKSELSQKIFTYFFCILASTVSFVIPYFFFLISRNFIRLEIFVQRRLLVRFDRVNRKVYLHRPKYAGGIVALPWDDNMVDLDPQVNLSGIPLSLSWNEKDTPHGLPDGTLVGRNTRSDQEMRDRWEFIRRFMEDGPQSVPREKCLSKYPWPWKGPVAVCGMVWPFFSEWLNWIMLIGAILLIPAMLFYSFFHWLSLLLCWEPVFPREIRQACGESFMAVLKARLVDLVAWAMLGGFIWCFLPALQEWYLSLI